MITIPRLTEEELIFFKGKKILIYGRETNRMIQLNSIFKYFKLEVVGYYSPQRSENFLLKLIGLKKLTLEKLQKTIQSNNNIIVQDLAFEKANIERTKEIVENWGVEYSPFEFGEISIAFAPLSIFKNFLNPVKYIACNAYWKYNIKCVNKPPYSSFKKSISKQPILICSAPKTADTTLTNTFSRLNQLNRGSNVNIEFLQLRHAPQRIAPDLIGKKLESIRIIMGLREPISQNISVLYQLFSTGNIYFDWILGDLENKTKLERKSILEDYQKLFLQHGNDVQVVWNRFVERYVYPHSEIRLEYPKAIQQFIPEFGKCVLDISQYSFDKEKGYTIIKAGNIDVFVYQLERLNDIAPEISEWVGGSFDKWENKNMANDKWVGASYKQALKEIEITQEYFDKCFDEPYVKHCYSEADIEKFKARWRPHIKKEV